jgi:acetylglutamate kinase
MLTAFHFLHVVVAMLAHGLPVRWRLQRGAYGSHDSHAHGDRRCVLAHGRFAVDRAVSAGLCIALRWLRRMNSMHETRWLNRCLGAAVGDHRHHLCWMGEMGRQCRSRMVALAGAGCFDRGQGYRGHRRCFWRLRQAPALWRWLIAGVAGVGDLVLGLVVLAYALGLAHGLSVAGHGSAGECGTICASLFSPDTHACAMTDLLSIAPRDKAEILAQALPYIRKFHGKTMVIKYGGNAMTDPALQADFAEDVVLLKLVGMNPVVVHGGGPQIEAALNRLGKKGEFIQGMRVTDAETMEVVEWVLAGEVQQDIVGLINQAGGKAVGLTGRDGGMIRARKLKMVDNKDPNIEHDVGQVGDIVSIDPSVVKALQDDAFIPVISPIGFGENNESYNINADVVASKLAEVLQGRKADAADQHARRARQGRQPADRPDGAPHRRAVCRRHHLGGMLPKIAGALDAAKAGVNAVHIIDGRVPHAMLLEILTEQAYGTMIRSH